jgi:hypothetical protein
LTQTSQRHKNVKKNANHPIDEMTTLDSRGQNKKEADKKRQPIVSSLPTSQQKNKQNNNI